MFQIKKYQTNYRAIAWQQSLKRREIKKNSFRINGDIKKAKAFVHMVSRYQFTAHVERTTEHVIFYSSAG